MKKALAFDDVLLVPTFSEIDSRLNVQPYLVSEDLLSRRVLPIFTSNMDTITDDKMANAVKDRAIPVLHRFCTIEENVEMYKKSPKNTWCSIGITINEFRRFTALQEAGCSNFLIDVANAANNKFIIFFNSITDVSLIKNKFIVGNFATKDQVMRFLSKIDNQEYIHAIKLGVGSGSVCSTRVVTGCGLPTLASVLDCKDIGIPIIADGGIKNSGDIVKCLAAGASAVMLGNMLAGTEETPGEVIYPEGNGPQRPVKKYRGSASLESYQVQGKVATWRSPEGESTCVSYKGSVHTVLDQIEGGIRSAMSYLNASTLEDLRNAEMIEITNHGAIESKPFLK